jgi:hypothetical protein
MCLANTRTICNRAETCYLEGDDLCGSGTHGHEGIPSICGFLSWCSSTEPDHRVLDPVFSERVRIIVFFLTSSSSGESYDCHVPHLLFIARRGLGSFCSFSLILRQVRVYSLIVRWDLGSSCSFSLILRQVRVYSLFIVRWGLRLSCSFSLILHQVRVCSLFIVRWGLRLSCSSSFTLHCKVRLRIIMFFLSYSSSGEGYDYRVLPHSSLPGDSYDYRILPHIISIFRRFITISTV